MGELGKFIEAFHQVLTVAIDVQMVGINGVDDANGRTQVKERTVKFVGFHDHEAVLAFTQKEVASEIVGDAPDKGESVASTGV